VHWDDIDQPLIEFTAALAALRKAHPTFRRSRFFDGRPVRRAAGAPIPDIVWGRPDGSQMQPEDWDSGFGRAIGVFLNGTGIRGRDARGRAIVDRHYLVLFNAGDEIIDFHIPDVEFSPKWDVVVDTAGERADSDPIAPGSTVRLEAKSMLVMQDHRSPVPGGDHSVAASVARLVRTAEPAPAPKAELRH
jgi:glycogen operon protein